MANIDNRPLLVHANHLTKFVAAAGNAATGIRDAIPDVAGRMGAATIGSVNASNGQVPCSGVAVGAFGSV